MSLASVTRGAGPDLVMIPGWGMHAGVFAGLADSLSSRFRVTCVDLPGHGNSAGVAWPDDVGSVADLLLAAAPPRAAWLGWSLGGLAAIAASAREADRIDRLVLLAATPRFTATGDWPCAMSADELAGFAERFERHPERTLQRFQALQFSRDVDSGRGLRRLRALLGDGEIAVPALAAALRVLLEADMRAALAACGRPVCALLGGDDPLIPACVSSALSQLLPRIRIERIEGAGHAPFITHEEVVAATIADMLQEPAAPEREE